MNILADVGLFFGGLFALAVAGAGALIAVAWWLRRGDDTQRPPLLLCVMCDREVGDTQRVTCSDICCDMWLGEFQVNR